jgi:hypothetical protein
MPEDETSSRSKRALKRLRKPGDGGLESAAAPDMSADRIKTSLEAARERFRKIAERAHDGREELTHEQERVLADAEAALKKLAAEGPDAQVTDPQMVGLEAVIVPDGTRPSLFVRDDDVEPSSPDAGTWKGRISELRTSIAEVARSVGRINSAVTFPNYGGTGWVVADGLIATNRHVVEWLTGGPDPKPAGSWVFLKPVTIDFAAEFERKRKNEFKVTGVVFTGPDAIKGTLSPPKLDLALLKVEKTNADGALPPPLRLSRRIKSLDEQREVYVMGYPARSTSESGKVLLKVFQDEYFVKRFAPGYVDDTPDAVEDGGNHRVFTHDASTLGGNSGSCVVEFLVEGRAVVGLHFGGFSGDKNYAHAVARIEQVLAQHGAKFQDN